MARFDTQFIAKLYSSFTDVIGTINTAKTSDQTDEDYKDKIRRSVEHLETIKGLKQEDGTTSIWTTEDFTDVDAAITKGKGLI